MRYFFEFTGSDTSSDAEGVELADLPAAQLEAARACTEWLRDHAEHLLIRGRLSIEIRDDAGHVLDSIGLAWIGSSA